MVVLSTHKELGLSVVEYEGGQDRYLLGEESDDEIYEEKLALEARRGSQASEVAGRVSWMQLGLIYSLHLAEAYVLSIIFLQCTPWYGNVTNANGLLELLHQAYSRNCICSSGMKSSAGTSTPSTGPELLRQSLLLDQLPAYSGDGWETGLVAGRWRLQEWSGWQRHVSQWDSALGLLVVPSFGVSQG